jgi:hypothetical protein
MLKKHHAEKLHLQELSASFFSTLSETQRHKFIRLSTFSPRQKPGAFWCGIKK